jgi:hypothetical protein
MADETWMDAADAIDAGFADLVTEQMRVAACAGFDYSKFKHAPAKITAELRAAGHSVTTLKVAAMGKRLRGG